MPLSPMKIVRDEPQQLLVLETAKPGVPVGAFGCLTAGIFGLVFGVPCVGFVVSGFQPGPDRSSLLVGAFFVVFGLVISTAVFSAMRNRTRYPLRVRVDRYASELEIAEAGLLGSGRTLVVPLDRITRIEVGSAMVPPNVGDLASGILVKGPKSGVRLKVEWRDGENSESHALAFSVDDLNLREEVADFAYRIGRAAGLFYSRVLRSDPRELEIEVTRERGPGCEALPVIESPAEYAHDRVLAPALKAASEEKVPAFAPAEFQADLKVAVWEPRREVRFRRPLGFAAFGCLPFTLLVLLGPVVFVLMGRVDTSDEPAARWAVSGMAGVFGLVMGLFAMAGVASGLPKSVTLDWAANSLEMRGVIRVESRALSDIRELELKCVRTYRSGGKNSPSYHTYRCDLVGHLQRSEDGKPSLVLVATNEFREDPATPYRISLPLATELAAALGVPRKVTEFS